MNRIFITHILPLDECCNFPKMSVAACNFCWNLLGGGAFDEVYSLLPSNPEGVDYPLFKFNKTIVSSLRKKHGIARKIAPLVEQWNVFKKIPRGSSVWFYNLTVLSILLYILLRLFKRRCKCYIIVLDYDPSNRFDKIALPLINRAHGLITLSSSSLLTNRNSIIMPGVVPLSDNDYPVIPHIQKNFLLSGVLNEKISMISKVIEIFSKMPECNLQITGFFDDDDYIRRKIDGCRNIQYHGKVDKDTFFSILHSTTFVLSTRDPKYPENQCNFPSKVIEALLHNRIVISTIEYPQLKDINYLLVSSDQDKLKSDILNYISQNEDVLLQYANQSPKMIALFNANKWTESISQIENQSR